MNQSEIKSCVKILKNGIDDAVKLKSTLSDMIRKIDGNIEKYKIEVGALMSECNKIGHKWENPESHHRSSRGHCTICGDLDY